MSATKSTPVRAEVWVEQRGSTREELEHTLESVARALGDEQRAVLLIADPSGEVDGRSLAAKAGVDVVVADSEALTARLDSTDASAVVWIRRAVIRPDAVERLRSVMSRFPGVAVAIADSVDARGRPLRRPDESPLRLRSQDHLGPVVAFRVEAAIDAGGFAAAEASVLLYELMLRMAESRERFLVVPEALAVEREGRIDADRWRAECEAVDAHLRSIGVRAVVEQVGPGVRRIRYPLDGHPLVSVIIPTRGTAADVAGHVRVLVVEAIRGIVERSTYPNLEFVVVADSVTPRAVVDDLHELLGERLRIVEWDRPFNFSAKVNHGIAAARGRYLLVLNDDVDLVTGDWIETLVGLADQQGVGAVGALLYFEDGSIQHAGHLYSGGSPGHVGFMERCGYDDALSTLSVDHEVSGVTGACLFVSAEIARQVGGFSLELPSNYNDVDFCLKVRATGRRIILSPFVRLYHFESKTRDPSVSIVDTERLQRRWRRQLEVEMYSRMQVD